MKAEGRMLPRARCIFSSTRRTGPGIHRISELMKGTHVWFSASHPAGSIGVTGSGLLIRTNKCSQQEADAVRNTVWAALSGDSNSIGNRARKEAGEKRYRKRWKPGLLQESARRGIIDRALPVPHNLSFSVSSYPTPLPIFFSGSYTSHSYLTLLISLPQQRKFRSQNKVYGRTSSR